MDNHVDHPHRRSVYYDDSCELCESAAQKIRADIDLDTVGGSQDLPAAIQKSELMNEVHAMDESGVIYKGVDAIIVILRWHPRWFWLAPVIALPGIKQVTGAGYRVVARNRHRWFRRR
jgi:predicted DCC family thiol-disulfide oxidoreductase YuxK